MPTYGYVIIGIVFVVFVWAIITYNTFVSLRNKTEEAFSTMDVYLKKRYDLVPNLVDTVKGYAAHEQETFQKVTDARVRAMSSENIADRQASETALSQTLRSLFALAENYPMLKADTAFVQLQQQLQGVEEDIAQARKYYNAVVKTMNTKVEMFPSNIAASIMGFKKYPFFMVENEERANVRVNF
ncbi:MAG: LemA family protein [Eubacteriales bacterium]|nr:LemA family protein [Eubacteriales bacterium]